MSSKDNTNQTPDDDLLRDSTDPTSIGEMILKEAVLTASSKGISSDLKDVIKIKVDFLSHLYSETSKITETLINSNNKSLANHTFIKEKGQLNKLHDHILSEIFSTNIAINHILTNFIMKEKNIKEEFKEMLGEDMDKMLQREMKKINPESDLLI